MPFQEKRAIRILNGLALALIASVPFFMLPILSLEDPESIRLNLLINVCNIVPGFIVLYLSGCGKWRVGLHFLAWYFMVFLLILPLVGKQFTGVNLHYIVIISFSIMVSEDRLSKGIYLILGSLFMGASTWINSPANPFGLENSLVVFSINIPLVTALMYVILNGFKQESAKYQDEITGKNQLLEEQQEEIKTMNERLALKNQQIGDSIRSALRIQEAVLPDPAIMNHLLPEHFVLFRPKDVVSGDFYWLHEKDGHLIIAVGDCTGHGVPGALMSMLSINGLEQIVIERGITSPEKILEESNRYIRKSLRQHSTKNHDGLTLAVCTIPRQRDRCLLAGAASPILVVQNGKSQEIASDRHSIGGSRNPDNLSFNVHTVPILAETTVYLYSDGYKDQFGGPDGRKFMSKRFRETLISTSLKPLPEQKQELEKTLDSWMETSRKESQTDDITVLGIRLRPSG